MLAARMYGYHHPLELEDIKVPEIGPDDVLVRVGGAGMCRSDVQLIDGYFEGALHSTFPLTPGHEIAGLVMAIGDHVPASAELTIGDQVVVAAGWGDGICRQCRVGDEQLCEHGSWPGFGPPGGYAEFVPVPYRQLIRVQHRLKWEELAPLTDAGVTPYRAIKKLRAAGMLGPDRVMGVFGASGLGSYAVQYAKLLSSGATVVAFARNDEKLAIAKQRGADATINTRGKSLADIQDELYKLTGSRKLDAAIDCVGAEETIQTGIGLLHTSGAFVSVGLVGTKINIPLFPFTASELTYHGSFWANYNDLQEVLALAEKGKIQHTIRRIEFKDINENLELLRAGEIIGRAVIVFDVPWDAASAPPAKH
ncbi:NAD(P)-dependent alcohol dehydrogenase [Granulicella sibirica]|uniref:alcohol dehydrogenase n=1 Tax=Granulicella sibirica TaxID=2479048 RepID=A0A4Q0T348_9BACT|nr:NAD(P)-dependent alcohol dehydrogenase [Granulicella sibirica]RXH58125.1 alcohol dehydrogenase [Granulicella sibirica]